MNELFLGRQPTKETVTSHIQSMSTGGDADSITSTNSDRFFDGEGTFMLNQYVIQGAVGKGHNGSVRRCHVYEQEGRPLAIKIVKRDTLVAQRERQLKQLRRGSGNPAVVDRIHTLESKIRREIAIMKRCNHPHVVKLYEVIDDRSVNMIYMVMELLAGGEIRWHDHKGQPALSVDQSRRIIRDTILGLEYLHYQGIIHRDIKPANLVYTTNRERVKIVDFGVAHSTYAQQLAEATSGQTTTKERNSAILNDAELARIAGSPPFIAPEVVFDYTKGSSRDNIRPPITKAIDVWALGVTLYCFLFGCLPFPPPDNDDLTRFQKELEIYRKTCNDDWAALPTMGSDRVPTGGRHPREESSPGGQLMHLMEHLLTKDCRLRITLREVKGSPWCLQDVGNPEMWLKETSPEPINPTLTETKSAMVKVAFKWRRITDLLRGRPRSEEADAAEGRGPVVSMPESRRRKSYRVNPTSSVRPRVKGKEKEKEKPKSRVKDFEKPKSHPWHRMFKLSISRSPVHPPMVIDDEMAKANIAAAKRLESIQQTKRTDLRGGRKSAEALGAYHWPWANQSDGRLLLGPGQRSSSYGDNRHPRELERFNSWDTRDDESIWRITYGEDPVFRAPLSDDDDDSLDEALYDKTPTSSLVRSRSSSRERQNDDSDDSGGPLYDDLDDGESFEEDDYESSRVSLASDVRHSRTDSPGEKFLTFSPSKRRALAAAAS